jgi:hypothetical protein
VTAYDRKTRQGQNLTSHTRAISSPIDGLIGTTQKKVGALVGRGESTLLTTDLAGQSDPVPLRDRGGRIPKARSARRGSR